MPIDTTRVAADILRVLPREKLSRWIGRLAGTTAPPGLVEQAVRLYARAYDVDLTEAEIPEGGFTSFDAFFTRRLRAGARPVDPRPGVLVSPADGVLAASGPMTHGARFDIKGHEYTVGELVGEPDAAQRFADGWFSVVYLHPRNYHRVHAPVDGRVEASRHIAGTLYPVNEIGVRHVPRVFARNERVAVHQISEKLGEVVTILVGAVGVGHISLSFDPDVHTNNGRAHGLRRYGASGVHLARGDELGMFHLGSTVIVLTQARARLVTATGPGSAVRMGERIAARGEG